MTTSTFNQDIFNARLEQLVADKKLTRNSIVYRTLKNLPEVIRPCTVSGSGRFVKNNDQTDVFTRILRMAGITFEQGNDAPRGGKAGNFIKITGILTDEQMEAERKAKEQPRQTELSFYTDGDSFCITVHLAGELPVQAIIEGFAAKGFTVTEEAIRHNFEAWKGDYKSNFHDEQNGIDLFSPCGCNPLSFWAYPINSNLSTYIA